MKIESKVEFEQNGQSLIDVLPETEVTVIVTLTNNGSRAESAEVSISTPYPGIELPKKPTKERIGPRGQENVRFDIKTPRSFGDIALTVNAKESGGIGRFGMDAGTDHHLTIRMQTSRVVEVTRDPKVDDHIQAIQDLQGTVVMVPEISPTSIGVLPVVGDLSSTPTIAMTLIGTTGLKLQLSGLDNRGIVTMKNALDDAQTELEKVTEDQDGLGFFRSHYTTYLKELGADVMQDINEAHIAVGPSPKIYYYITQISPSEDEGVLEKINAVISKARSDDADVTLLVTKIDNQLVDLAETKQINVVNIFSGAIVKGKWSGDQFLDKYLEDLFQLDLVDYKTSPEGLYTPSSFKAALNNLSEVV